MVSITKHKLNYSQIMKLMAVFGKNSEVASIQELTDGYFNVSYLIQFTDGKKTVLKIAPKDDVKVLTYEKNIMKTEVTVLNQLAMRGLPVPLVIYFDMSYELIDSNFFFMTYVEGKPLKSVRDQMGVEAYNQLSKSLGKYVRSISSIKGDYFGSIHQENRRYDNWTRCFKMMIKDLMEDAEAENVSLPITKPEALELVDRYHKALSEVHTPTLIHKDLWEGNIFVDERTFVLKGIIDCERALYGEPLLEAVCGFLDENTYFMNSYYGRNELSQNEQIRVKLYKFYLFLLMVVECQYRRYQDGGFEQWARETLENIIIDLGGKEVLKPIYAKAE